MTASNYRRGYYAILILRLVAPFFIFISAIPAIFGVTFLDILDGLFAARGEIKKTKYQYIDKGLDLFWYGISLVFILLDSRFEDYRIILAGLFAYRLIGSVLYWLTAKKTLLFIFANFYENILFLVIFGTLVPQLNFLLQKDVFILAALILVLLKLVQERFVHLVPYSFTEKYLRIRLGWKE